MRERGRLTGREATRGGSSGGAEGEHGLIWRGRKEKSARLGDKERGRRLTGQRGRVGCGNARVSEEQQGEREQALL